MSRATLAVVFVASILLGLAVSPEPSEAYTPPLPRVEAVRPAPLEPEIVVHVDVPLKVAPNVIEAIRAWERVTRGWRRWRLGGIAEAHMWIIQVEPGRGHCPDFAAACAAQMGGLEREPPDAWGRAWLIRGEYEPGAKVITMHEIGHALGLRHVDGTLMQSHMTVEMYLNPWTCPDGESLARLQWRLGVVLDTRECAP